MSNQQKHTPTPCYRAMVEGEPLQTFSTAGAALDYATRHVYLPGSRGEEAMRAIQSGEPFHYSYGFRTVTIDRIGEDRIAACVRACEGINPEAVPEMLEALRWIRDKCTGLPAVARALAEKAIAKAEGR